MMGLARPIAIAVLTVMLLTSGCASMKQDLLKKDLVKLETVPVEDVTYLYTNVWQEGVKIDFSGRVADERWLASITRTSFGRNVST